MRVISAVENRLMPTARLIPAHLLERARLMRSDPAPAEAKLWRCLRDRQMSGYKFRRQRPMSPYIADFCCVALRLVIELDGDSHADTAEYDARRTARLERGGYRVIRFVNDDVNRHLDAVLDEVLRECERLGPAPSPGMPGEGRGEGDFEHRRPSVQTKAPSP